METRTNARLVRIIQYLFLLNKVLSLYLVDEKIKIEKILSDSGLIRVKQKKW